MNVNDWYLYNFLQNLQTQGKRKYVPGQYGYGYVPGEGGYAWKAGNQGKLTDTGAYFKTKLLPGDVPENIPTPGDVSRPLPPKVPKMPVLGLPLEETASPIIPIDQQSGSGQGVQKIPVAQPYTGNTITPTGLAASPEMLIAYLVALDNYLKNRGKV